MVCDPINVFRSVYLRDGTLEIRDFIKEISALGVKALGICNSGNLIGVIKFHEEALEAGIKPIIGLQVEIISKRKAIANNTLNLFAYNMTGYFNLVAIASEAILEENRLKLVISKELLEKHHEGLVCFSGDGFGLIYRYLSNYQYIQAKNVAKYCANLFGEKNFYIELQSKENETHSQINKMLVQIARDLNLPLMATKKTANTGELSNRTKYIYPEFDTGNLSEREKFKPHEKIDFDLLAPIFYFNYEDDNLKSMQLADEIIENTKQLLDKINFEEDFGKKHYPNFEVPADANDMQALEELAMAGLKTHYPLVEEFHVNRIKQELEVIDKRGWIYFFFIYGDICNYASLNGFHVSGAFGQFEGSLVAYVLDLTDIDPIRFGLVFELFFRKNRPYNMNIVIDACKEKQSFIVNYFYEKYGEKNVSKINYTDRKMFTSERRLRFIAKAFKVSREKIYRFTRLYHREFVTTKSGQLNNEFYLRQLCASDPQMQGLMNIAMYMYNRDLPIADDCHLLLSNGLINNQMPVFQSQYGLVAQYSNFEIKNFHLLKIYIEDKSFFSEATQLSRTLELISRSRNIYLDINDIPRNDQAVFSLIKRGDLLGLPHFYHDETFEFIVKRVKLEVFDDFIFMVNLNYRNYIEIDGIPNILHIRGYMEIKKECSSLWLSHPVLCAILRETDGCIFYVEQVIKIAHSIAGFSMIDANEFLFSILLKQEETSQTKMTKDVKYQKFINGCIANGMAKDLAEEIYAEMTQFWKSSKSFVVSMALPAYQLAYLKHYYPEEFLATYYSLMIKIHNGYIEDFASECKSHQIEILQPNINESLWDLKPTPGKIRLGFSAIKHTAKRAIQDLIHARATGPFLNLQDFCDRCAKNHGDLATFEALTTAGCFDSFDKSRNKIIVNIMLAIEIHDLKNMTYFVE